MSKSQYVWIADDESGPSRTFATARLPAPETPPGATAASDSQWAVLSVSRRHAHCSSLPRRKATPFIVGSTPLA
jgi:hypothetical protein